MLILGKCWFHYPDHNNLIRKKKPLKYFILKFQKFREIKIPSKASVTASDSSEDESPSRSSSSLSLETEITVKIYSKFQKFGRHFGPNHLKVDISILTYFM